MAFSALNSVGVSRERVILLPTCLVDSIAILLLFNMVVVVVVIVGSRRDPEFRPISIEKSIKLC